MKDIDAIVDAVLVKYAPRERPVRPHRWTSEAIETLRTADIGAASRWAHSRKAIV